MSEHRLHRIDEYLSEDWIEAWAGEVIADVEAYLAKRADFDAFLQDRGE